MFKCGYNGIVYEIKRVYQRDFLAGMTLVKSYASKC